MRTLIVDDSAVDRQLLRGILSTDLSIKVVGEAHDGQDAVAKAKKLKPDVITMDIAMPHIDGLEATRQIMEACPCPIVVISSHHPNDVTLSVKALDAGALTILSKPPGPTSPDFTDRGDELINTVKLMGDISVVTRRRRSQHSGRRHRQARVKRIQTDKLSQPEVVAIGASTGGPPALRSVLTMLPRDFPAGVVIVQHITPGYHRGLLSTLQPDCKLPIELGDEGTPIEPGRVILAPGECHMEVTSNGRVHLDYGIAICGHRPSVSYLFASLAQTYGSRALGVILTGMGSDGASGMLDLHNSGATTIAQDEASSVVYGMPGEAVKRGAVDWSLPIEEIGQFLLTAAPPKTNSQHHSPPN